MALLVVNGATLLCSGALPPAISPLTITPENAAAVSGNPVATISDMRPLVNIASFGMCTLPSNPQVAAATAAALGVLTPQPCIPNIVSPWTPGSGTVTLRMIPTLNNTSQCVCVWGGIVTVTNPGQAVVLVP